VELAIADWKRINRIILGMNCEDDVPKALKTFLLGLCELIPYEKASVYFYVLSKGKYKVERYIAEGFYDKELFDYDAYYFQIDDILDKMLPHRLHTVRSSELFDMRERARTEYYNDYVRPVRTHFSLDANFVWGRRSREEIRFGTLDIFRPTGDGDFTEREAEICRILQPHLETKASRYSLAGFREQTLREFDLTPKETEVAALLLRGYTNEQIAFCHYITVSTVKKHVARIFAKTGCSSRVDFICRVGRA
jgi:DNA-binding CsgD family transcriptional regulator